MKAQYAVKLHGSHFPTTSGTTSACRHTIVHGADRLATLGAGLAHIRASSAHLSMQRRGAQHEIRGQLANIGAVHHQLEMRFLDVLPAFLKAIAHCHAETDLMAIRTGCDTGLKLGVDVLTHDVSLGCRRGAKHQRRANFKPYRATGLKYESFRPDGGSLNGNASCHGRHPGRADTKFLQYCAKIPIPRMIFGRCQHVVARKLLVHRVLMCIKSGIE